jgi:hypothetical protein
LLERLARRLIGAVPPPGSALWFWRTDDAWIVDSISAEKAATFPTRGRA